MSFDNVMMIFVDVLKFQKKKPYEISHVMKTQSLVGLFRVLRSTQQLGLSSDRVTCMTCQVLLEGV